MQAVLALECAGFQACTHVVGMIVGLGISLGGYRSFYPIAKACATTAVKFKQTGPQRERARVVREFQFK